MMNPKRWPSQSQLVADGQLSALTWPSSTWSVISMTFRCWMGVPGGDPRSAGSGWCTASTGCVTTGAVQLVGLDNGMENNTDADLLNSSLVLEWDLDSHTHHLGNGLPRDRFNYFSMTMP